MTFEAFVEKAWADHGDRPGEVAERLHEGFAMIATVDHVAPFARLAAHVEGEHLGRWQHGLDWLQRLRTVRCWPGDGDAVQLVRRLEGALRHCAGQPLPAGFGPADRVHALAVAASSLAGQKRAGDAIAALDSARSAAGGITGAEPALRVLAIAGNNLACELEARDARTADETRAMLVAARTGREYWERAGSWLEIERADYVLAKCHLAAGDTEAALAHAQACADLCAANGADDFERFFAHAAVALALRAAGDDVGGARERGTALAHYDAVPADLRSWCDKDVRLLN